MRLALYQGPGTTASVPANLETMVGMAARAAERGAELLAFPEMFLSGYNIGDAAAALAEPAGGSSARRLGQAAKRHGLALVYGFPERDGDRLFNAANLIGPDGTLLATHRKAHLYGADEKRCFAAGAAPPPLVTLAGLKVAVMICYDAEFPEYVRRAALDGAALLVVPTALMDPHERVARLMIPARAMENGIFLAYANRTGSEGKLSYCGQSCLVAPDGADLARAGRDEALLVGEVDPAAYAGLVDALGYLGARRPDLYPGGPRSR